MEASKKEEKENASGEGKKGKGHGEVAFLTF